MDCSITQPLRYDRPSLQDLCAATGQCTGGAVSRRSKVTIETDIDLRMRIKPAAASYKVMVRHGFSSGVCDVALPATAEWSQKHPRGGW